MILDRDKFKAWLHSLDEGQVAGERGSTRCCPIALYIRNTVEDVRHVSVGAFIAYDNSFFEEVVIDLPEWAEQFIHTIDDRLWSDVGNPEVTAQEALEVLDVIG